MLYIEEDKIVIFIFSQNDGGIMKKKFYKGRSDIIFKGIFLKDSNRDMLKRLIEEAINKKVEILEVKASELPKGSVYEKGKILDVLVASDEGEINIEVNSYSDCDLHKRNASYIFNRYSSSIPVGGNYADMKNFIQINLTYADSEKSNDLEMISEYRLEEINRHVDYIKNLTVYEFNVSKIKEAWYNGDRTHGIMALLDADASELDTMDTGDEMMNRFKNEVKHMNMELGDVQFRDPDEDAEIIFNTIVANKEKKAAEKGREEGKFQAKLDMVKKLKDASVDVDIIASTTGLTLDEINNL